MVKRALLLIAAALLACSPVAAQTSGPGPSPSAGNVGGYSFQLGSGDGTQAAITVQNAAYAATNAMGGWQTLPLARLAGSSILLQSMALTSVSGQAFSGFIFVYSKNPAGTCTDKSAFAPSSADRPFEVPGSPFAFTTAVNTNSGSAVAKAVLSSLSAFAANKDTAPTVNFYACIVTSGAVTPGSTSDLVLSESGARD